jgi:hypothetical protein
MIENELRFPVSSGTSTIPSKVQAKLTYSDLSMNQAQKEWFQQGPYLES